MAAAGILQGTINTFLVLGRETGLLGSATPLGAVLATVVTAFAAWYIAFRDIRLSTRFTLFVELATLLLIAVVVVGRSRSAASGRSRATDAGRCEADAVAARDGARVLQLHRVRGATVLGAEARDPFRAIPRAVLISVVGPAILFVIGAYGMVSAFHGQTPPLDQVDGPLAVLAHRLGAGWVGVLIDAGVALSFFAAFFSSINAARGSSIRSGGRACCMRRRATRERNATPHVAVALITALALATALVFTTRHRAARFVWLSQFDRDVRLAACVRAGGDRRALYLRRQRGCVRGMW